LSCPQYHASNEQDSASCDRCGAALTGQGCPWYLADPSPADAYVPRSSASQYPRTPGEQFLPDNRAGRYIPGSDVPASQFRPDWRRLTRVEQMTGSATLVVFVSLFLPWFGFDSLGARISVSGTGAHGYLVVVALLAVLTAGYLLQRSGWQELPFTVPVAPETVLIGAAGLQFAGVAIGFADRPGPSWQFGAYLALIAAAAALGAALIPVLLRSWRAGPGPG
jgi:hypothetical protein